MQISFLIDAIAAVLAFIYFKYIGHYSIALTRNWKVKNIYRYLGNWYYTETKGAEF